MCTDVTETTKVVLMFKLVGRVSILVKKCNVISQYRGTVLHVLQILIKNLKTLLIQN